MDVTHLSDNGLSSSLFLLSISAFRVCLHLFLPEPLRKPKPKPILTAVQRVVPLVSSYIYIYILGSSMLVHRA